MGSAKARLYQYINWLRNKLNIDFDSYPIDTIEICSKMEAVEIQFHKFKTNGFCGAVLIGEKHSTILLNSNRNLQEKNFDCGHELIHLTKHRQKDMDCFSCMELKTKREPKVSFYEWEANEGAAELLVPMASLLPKIKRKFPHLKKWIDFCKFKQELAQFYGVTEAVIGFRLDSLKYEIDQYINDVDIEEIEILSVSKQNVKGIKVKSLNEFGLELLNQEHEACKPFTLNFSVLNKPM